MNTSKLSFKKNNNINRQIQLLKKDIIEIIDEDNGVKLLNLKSKSGSLRIRDFYEFYINDESFINIISNCYWANNEGEATDFFNSHIGCIGSFGNFWDEINISILTKSEFTKQQKSKLFELFKSNYSSSRLIYTNQNIKEKIAEDVRNNFLLYCCQDCGDSGCGGLTLEIETINDKIVWTDNEKIKIIFDLNEYNEILKSYLTKKNR